MAQLRADTVTAIEEIRRMVYAMRPPALDELGLVPALRQQAVGLRNRDGEPVAVDVTAPEEFPDLPAAVEVAAYRIVTEALTNVARHSTSASASVRLDPAADGLHLEVTDRGRSGAWRAGVGLASMRERATELGGTLEAGPGPGRRPGGRAAARSECSDRRRSAGYRVPRAGEWRGAMSNTVAMIIVVVAVVLVVAVVALLLMRTRGQERRAREAEELRTQAAAQSDRRRAGPARGRRPRRPPPNRRAQQAELAEAGAAEARA